MMVGREVIFALVHVVMLMRAGVVLVVSELESVISWWEREVGSVRFPC